MRRHCLSLFLLLAVLPAAAQDEPTVQRLDDGVPTLFGARDRLEIERYMVGLETAAPGPGSTAMLGSAGAPADVGG